MEKLQAVNADHIQASAPAALVDPLKPFLRERGIEIDAGDYATSVIETLQPRSKTLTDMAEAALFYYLDDIVFEENAARKFLKAAALEPLKLLVAKLKAAADYRQETLEDIFKAVMDETGLKLGKIAQPVRVALTGKTASPGIFEIITILGPERVVPRLEKAIGFIEERIVSNG